MAQISPVPKRTKHELQVKIVSAAARAADRQGGWPYPSHGGSYVLSFASRLPPSVGGHRRGSRGWSGSRYVPGRRGGESLRAIAGRRGRTPSTISREVAIRRGIPHPRTHLGLRIDTSRQGIRRPLAVIPPSANTCSDLRFCTRVRPSRCTRSGALHLVCLLDKRLTAVPNTSTG